MTIITHYYVLKTPELADGLQRQLTGTKRPWLKLLSCSLYPVSDYWIHWGMGFDQSESYGHTICSTSSGFFHSSYELYHCGNVWPSCWSEVPPDHPVTYLLTIQWLVQGTNCSVIFWDNWWFWTPSAIQLFLPGQHFVFSRIQCTILKPSLKAS